MTISRWKVMACTLAVAVGGVALMAGQSNNKLNAQWDVSGYDATPLPLATATEKKATPTPTEPAPLVVPVATKPAPVPSAPETLPPVVVPVIEMNTPKEIVPVAAPPAPALPFELVPEPATTEPAPPAKPQVVSDPPAAEPTKAATAPATPNKVEAPPPAPMDIEIVKPAPPAPPATPPMSPGAPPAPDRGSAPPAPPAADPLLVTPPTRVPPMVLTPPVPPPSPPAPSAPSASQAASKLKMLLRLGDGKPRFEIRDTAGADMLLKVYGEKIEMQSAPNDGKKSAIEGVTAVGKVRFVGPGIEGTCDQLSVLSGTGEVMLKGNVLLKTKRGKTWSEMSAEKMIYQIGSSGLTSPVSRPVTPAAYNTSR
jgi:hypothetical protein